MSFKDHFSGHAKEYSKFRPKYPDELFKFLSGAAKEHETAWDCATGNGQAALGLAPYFRRVIATDASASQIEHAVPNKKVTYKVAAAENSDLETGSVDLLTVATAIHWIDLEKFYPEVRRVLKPGGVIAVWLYTDNNINEEIDKVSSYFAHEFVEPYWPLENKKVWTFEESVVFPFERIETPGFKIELKWSLKDYLSFLYTWSSTQAFIKQTGKDPIELVYEKFKKAWVDENTRRTVTWKLKIKAGRV